MRESTTLIHVDPTALETDPENIRREGPGDLDTLAERLRQHGVLQPVGADDENGGLRIVYGNRRRDAAIIAGLPTIPCLLLEPRDDDRLVWQLLENLQRRDLNDLDKADGLARLRRRIGRDPGEVSERELDELTGREVGLSAATVRRYLGLRELAPGVRDLLAEGELSVTQAQHLRGLSDVVLQESLARLAAERGSSAAVLGRAARLLTSQPSMSPEEALGQAERGIEAVVRREPIEELTRLARPPRATDADAKEDRDDEPDETERDGPAGPATADGHRRFKFKSVGAFADETDRLARALQEGDLARAAGEEPDAPIQLRLALRQLRFVTSELEKLLRRNGWFERS